MVYTTRTEAIQREIIDPIEASGISSAADYDIDAIADWVLGDYDTGYTIQSTEEEFWQVVAENEL